MLTYHPHSGDFPGVVVVSSASSREIRKLFSVVSFSPEREESYRCNIVKKFRIFFKGLHTCEREGEDLGGGVDDVAGRILLWKVALLCVFGESTLQTQVAISAEFSSVAESFPVLLQGLFLFISLPLL